MNRIRMAWRALTGGAGTLELTEKVTSFAREESSRYVMDVNDYLMAAMEFHREVTDPSIDQMVNEVNVVNLKGIAK